MSTRRLEMRVEQLQSRSAGQLVELGKKSDAINRLKIEVNALRDQLRATTEPEAASVHEAGYVLSGRKMEQPKPAGESSLPAPAQTIEISALKIQVQTSTGQMDQARNELRTVEERRDAERIELKAADRKLMEAHSKLENFRRRVAELVGQVLAQTAEDEDLRHRAQDLENRLVEQSRQLNESEIEIEHLRGEIDVVRKAEADLRIAMVRIPPPKTSRPRRKSYRPRSTAPMASACGSLTIWRT